MTALSIAVLTALAQSPWTRQTTPTTSRIRGLTPVDSLVVWASGGAGAVLRTVDGGANWILKTAPASGFDIYAIEALDSLTAWAFGTATGVTTTGEIRIWKTTDGGTSWNQQYANMDSYSDAIHFFDTDNGVAVGDPASTAKKVVTIVTTTNGGATWTQVPAVNIPEVDDVADEVSVVNGCEVIGNVAWFVTFGNSSSIPIRVFKSTDRGLTWSASPQIPLLNSYGFAMSDANKGLICNISGQIGWTSDGWATSDTAYLFGATYGFRDVETIPGTAVAVLVGGPASTGFSATSTDGGATWTPQAVPSGVQRLYVASFLNPGLGWAAGNAGAIIKWTGSPIVGVRDQRPVAPEAFSLHQNYPNPFNPSTTIGYAIPQTTQVDLRVYDMLGREVATLVRQQQIPGTYTVRFDGTGLGSGVYFYTLRAGSFASTKSLVLIK